MKKLVLIFLFSLTLSFQSCIVSEVMFCTFNNEEIIQIDSGDKGSYSLKLDLHDFISAISKGMPEMNNTVYNSIKIDTTIMFNDYLKKYPKKLTEQEYAMFKNGFVKLNYSASEEKETVLIKLFYNGYDQLNFDREHIFFFVVSNLEFIPALLEPKQDFGDTPMEVISKLGFEMPRINFNVGSPNKEIRHTEIPDVMAFNPLGRTFKLKISENSIQNNLISIPVFEKALESNKSLQSMKDEGLDVDTVVFRTTFIVSKGITEYNGLLEKISPDKKEITFKNTLSEILNSPKKTEYFIRF